MITLECRSVLQAQGVCHLLRCACVRPLFELEEFRVSPYVDCGLVDMEACGWRAYTLPTSIGAPFCSREQPEYGGCVAPYKPSRSRGSKRVCSHARLFHTAMHLCVLLRKNEIMFLGRKVLVIDASATGVLNRLIICVHAPAGESSTRKI